MSNLPAFKVFTVIERETGKNYWQQIGSAWYHKDGQGIGITLNSLPLDGKLVMLPPRDDENKSDAQDANVPPPVGDDDVPF